MATFQRLRDLVSGCRCQCGGLRCVPAAHAGSAVHLRCSARDRSQAAMTAVTTRPSSVGLGLAQIPHSRRWHAAVRTLSGRLFQYICGIAKIRACGAEAAVFASWAESYRRKHLAAIGGSRIDEHLAAFGAAFPFGFAAGAVHSGDRPAATASPQAISSWCCPASLTLYAAVADLGRAIDTLAEAFTSYEQIAPVLAAVPERSDATRTPVRLDGDVVVDQVSFRYAPDSPARPRRGDHLCSPRRVCRPSWARQARARARWCDCCWVSRCPSAALCTSTTATLRHLDSTSVRRQIGVVPQDSALAPGSLAENIIGMADDLTLDDAWAAARLAAVDADIAEMPMQMMTQVGRPGEHLLRRSGAAHSHRVRAGAQSAHRHSG